MRPRALAVFFAGCAAFGFAGGIALSAFAQDAGSEPGMVDARLIASVDRVVPGKPFEVGLHQTIAPHWHTYWKNPGDSGEPTHIEWQMPEGFTASEIAWPIPEAIPVGPLTNYGYSDQVLLPVQITPPADIEASEVTLTAKATWLVCEEICIPENATLSIAFPVDQTGPSNGAGRHAAAFDAARRSLPIPIPWSVSASLGDDLELRIGATDLEPRRIESVRFFPGAWGLIEHAAPQRVDWHADGMTLTLTPGELARGDRPQAVEGVLVLTERLGDSAVRSGFRVSVQTDGAETPAAAAAPALARPGPAPTGDRAFTIWQAILFAVLGGIILNAMPCVLPILSLKVMSLARHSGQGAFRGGLAYLAGVLFSFAAIAGLVVALRAAGTSLGWGFQFQSPAFVLFMIALFFVLGLSMSGVFHIGGRLVGVGDSLTRRPGHAGSFFTGMLATVAATPCTAPFMGAAAAWAATQKAGITLSVFGAIGMGMALPYLVLAAFPALVQRMPRSGPTGVLIKQVMGLFMLAAAAYFIGAGSSALVVRPPDPPSKIYWWAVMGFIAAGGAWAVYRSWPLVQSRLAQAVCLLAGLAVLSASVFGGLRFTDKGPIDWIYYTENRYQTALAEGRVVVMVFTAAWCLNCKALQQGVLQRSVVADVLNQPHVAPIKVDITGSNPEGRNRLQATGQLTIPLLVVYAPDGRVILKRSFYTGAEIIAAVDRAAGR